MENVALKSLDHYWYSRNPVSIGLLPAAWLYRLGVSARRRYYRLTSEFRQRPEVPVVVVGNITTGGTGKTPMVIWLVSLLKKNGFKPGVVSRGYGGQSKVWPQVVTMTSDPVEVGDEPVLIARRARCPLVVAPDRMQAVRQLLDRFDCDVVVSDDGLQHYALQRDIEILMVDGRRRFGNGFCLPAGPLREPLSRLEDYGLIVANGQAADGEFTMALAYSRLINQQNPGVTLPLGAFVGKQVNAVAGIGNPARFYSTLRAKGIDVREHTFADHHSYTPQDLQFDDRLPILMTEKDAVKCQRFGAHHHWYLPISVRPERALAKTVIATLKRHGQKTA
ncbi:MAG: tetraacyldisaccharide 4'-kinase [Gammaproteobacteria bacterium]